MAAHHWPGPDPALTPHGRVRACSRVAELSACANANSESSSSTSCYRAQSLKLDRNRCPDAAVPVWRSACAIATLPIIAPGRVPGNNDRHQ